MDCFRICAPPGPRRVVPVRAALAFLLCAVAHGEGFKPGELVRVTRSEMLMFEGKNLVGVPKGQEFDVLKHDASGKRVYVSYVKDDGTLVALTVPEDAVEPAPPAPASDIAKGMEAFRDRRHEDSKRLLLRAAQDKQYAPLVAAISARIDAAVAVRPEGGKALETVRDGAVQLERAGYATFALHLDEGIDRLGAGAAPSKLDRAALAKRAAISQRCVMRARQAIALKRLNEASKSIEEGLQAEPSHLELKAFESRVKRDIADAEELLVTANKMRRFEGGVIHALSAIDDGLRLCSDHVRLRALRKELNAAFEERTSPRVTPAFLAAAKARTPAPALEEGRRLYTNRCTECHDLEMLDSRTITSWDKAVSSMSRRANLSAEEKGRIMEYIAAAQNVLDAGASR